MFLKKFVTQEKKAQEEYEIFCPHCLESIDIPKNLPQRRTLGFKCPYCGLDINLDWTPGEGWGVLSKSVEREKKLQAESLDVEIVDVKRSMDTSDSKVQILKSKSRQEGLDPNLKKMIDRFVSQWDAACIKLYPQLTKMQNI